MPETQAKSISSGGSAKNKGKGLTVNTGKGDIRGGVANNQVATGKEPTSPRLNTGKEATSPRLNPKQEPKSPFKRK